jgi:hypothetical protein
MNTEISNRTFLFITIIHAHSHMKHSVSNFLQKTKSSELYDIPSETQMWLPTLFWLLPELKEDLGADELNKCIWSAKAKLKNGMNRCSHHGSSDGIKPLHSEVDILKRGHSSV